MSTDHLRRGGGAPRMEYGERWMQLLEWFEEHGPRVQIRLADLMRELGWPQPAVVRHLSRMERYGCIAVMRTASGWATGRSANVYTLLMTAADWEERGPGIMRDHRRADRKARAEAKRREGKPNQVAVAIPALRLPSKQGRELEAQIEERLEEADQLEDAGDLDVDAWLAGG